MIYKFLVPVILGVTCNNQFGLTRRWARLDRCLVNSAWQDKFRSYSLKLLPKICSNHAPLLLSVYINTSFIRKNFQFETYWLDYIDCINVVIEAWNFVPHGNPMHALTHLFARTCSKVNLWRRLGFTSIDKAIQNVEADIHSLEQVDSLVSDVSLELSELYRKYSNLQRQIDACLAQRAHLNWLLNGDENTAFFHNMVQIHNHFNYISYVTDSNGNNCSDCIVIEQAFITFYTNFWTEPFDRNSFELALALPNDLPQISDVDGNFLTRFVTREEIYFVMVNLPSG